jgi:hypothetical protein
MRCLASLKTPAALITNNKKGLTASMITWTTIRFECNFFLTKNKVYFETLAATLLSCFAVIASIQTCSATNTQNEYVRMQTLLLNAQTSPQFVIIGNKAYNSKTGESDGEVIKIINKGGIAYDLRHRMLTFFEITSLSDTGYTVDTVFVQNYFYASWNNPQGNDTMASITGSPTNLSITSRKPFLACVKKFKNPDSRFETKRYLRLDYKDIVGRPQRQFYYIDFVDGAHQIDSTEGCRLFGIEEESSLYGNTEWLDSLFAMPISKIDSLDRENKQRNIQGPIMNIAQFYDFLGYVYERASKSIVKR